MGQRLRRLPNRIDARDGGINGVKITFEERDTAMPLTEARSVIAFERQSPRRSVPAFVYRHHFRVDRKSTQRQKPSITGGYGSNT